MKNDFVDPKVMHKSLVYCMLYSGSKDCFGLLHRISSRLYDADGNELTDINRYTAKIHFKCKCDKCGYETILPFDPDAPTILY
jgi:spore maturation protein CgeB